MKRYYLNSWVAKVLLMFTTCHTITLGFFVFSKNKTLSEREKNHETIHSIQWAEVTIVVGFILLLLDLFKGINLIYLSPFAYYILYVFEWLMRLTMYRDYKLAYKGISFEREAYINGGITEYIYNRPLFGWVKYIYG